ncbi:MAG: DUF1211 domain-containing protein [Chloroflexi bacterium]|nr:MAG: DUF1211 domain-containing protein [Chloroflexota bacterium]TMG38515.1 MAG: DUF1211 domain-containing protein [Chloroflexota bacterium]
MKNGAGLRRVDQTGAVRSSRLEAFSDGVFAIAATLLVLELRVPRDVRDLGGALLGSWPAYAAYVVSFATIGIIWVNHHVLLDHLRRVDRPLLYLNLLLLLSVAIVPFPTSLMDEYVLTEHGTIAAVVYGLVGLLIAIAFSSIFLYATRADGLCADAATARRIREEGRLFPIGLAAYVAGIALAFVSPIASLAVYGLIVVFYAFPQLPAASR